MKKPQLNKKRQKRKSAVMKAAAGTFGRSRGYRRENRESWWWNEEVQAALVDKKVGFKRRQKVKDATRKGRLEGNGMKKSTCINQREKGRSTEL